MDITISTDLVASEYLELVNAIGWKNLKTEQVERGLNNSMFKYKAVINGKTVGMARLVGDFGCHGMLTDVVVHPDYQGKGIGKKLVMEIMKSINDMLTPGDKFLVELLPCAGKRDFYIKLGFKYKPENMDGMYLWFEK